jgi:hypothetical protein
MRTVLAVTIALALCGLAASAATKDETALTNMVSAYHQLQAVRVVENFPNGASATVDVLPSGQYRIAQSTGTLDSILVLKLAMQPAPDISAPGTAYTVKSIGSKVVDLAKLQGYTVKSADQSFNETIWINERGLPVSATVQTQGQQISLQYGDYNDTDLMATK